MKYIEIAANFHFKKRKKEKGIRGVGEGTPPTDIFINKVSVGYIQTDNAWNQKNTGKWKIRLMMPADERALKENPNCPWMWGSIKTLFDTEQEARDFLKKNFNNLIKHIYIE